MLENNTMINSEIIVVDQNSESDSYLLNLFNLEKIRYIKLPFPNVSMARNIGYLASAGKLIVFMDDDLDPEVDFLNELNSFFIENPSVNCLVPNVFSDKMNKDLYYPRKKIIKDSRNSKNLFRITDYFSACLVIRSSVFAKTRGFDPFHFDFARTGEDQEFFLRILGLGIDLWYSTDISILHLETLEGGCELRLIDVIENRKRCVYGILLRFRLHNKYGNVTIRNIIEIGRFLFINKQLNKRKFTELMADFGLLKNAVVESRRYYNKFNLGFKFNYLDRDFLLDFNRII